MKQRITKVTETVRHKMAIVSLWMKNQSIRKDVSLFRVIFHDMEKLMLIVVCGDDFATKVHRSFAGHHTLSSQKDLAEAVLDWEVARITKPSKPLNARQTCEKYYSHVRSPVMQICDRWGI